MLFLLTVGRQWCNLAMAQKSPSKSQKQVCLLILRTSWKWVRKAAWLCSHFFAKLTQLLETGRKRPTSSFPLGGNEKREVCALHSSFP